MKDLSDKMDKLAKMEPLTQAVCEQAKTESVALAKFAVRESKLVRIGEKAGPAILVNVFFTAGCAFAAANGISKTVVKLAFEAAYSGLKEGLPEDDEAEIREGFEEVEQCLNSMKTKH